MGIKKGILVGIIVDYMGSGILIGGRTPEDEVREIKTYFKAFFGKEFQLNFVTSKDISELLSKPLDVFVIDYGGVLPGCSELVYSIMREVNRYAEEHPSSLVVLWTQCTEEYFREEIGYSEEGVLGKSINPCLNIVVMKSPVDVAWEKIRKWLRN